MIIFLILALLSGCTYGTYNASGSYPNQHNGAETESTCKAKN